MGLRDTVANMIKPVVSGFEDKNDAPVGGQVIEGIVAIITAVLIILVSGFIVKILWNNSMPYMFATARPVASIWTIYAFMLMVYFVV
jgi:hypothetical protein